MSRMFRVITGSGPDRHADPEAEASQPEAGVPFVEVGGPDGVVTSPGKQPPPPPRVVPRPAPGGDYAGGTDYRPEPAPSPIGSPHRQAGNESSRVLSVSFHRIPKAGLRVIQTGVSPDVVLYHTPDHPVCGEYRQVRDEIVKQFDEPGPKVILFTAATPSAGTSTVLVNFAVAMTQEYGSRVLLVDANFGRPGIARRFGSSEAPGLAEVLGQSLPLAWALQPTPVTNLHVLPTGTATDSTEEALSSDLPRLLNQLRQWFDWVVVDAGVWSELPNAEGACASSDGVFLVARSGEIELPGFGGLRGDVTAAGGIVRGFVSTRQ